MTDENINVKETGTKITQERKNYLNKVYEQIKQTMREPTIKAIVNWNMDPQLIGADSVLTEEDKNFIKQHQARKKIAKDALTDKKVSASYQRTAELLLEKGQFTDSEKELIKKGLADNASNDERLKSVAMLNQADYRYTNYDFEYAKNITESNAIIALSSLNTILLIGRKLTVNNAVIDSVNEDKFRKKLDDFIAYAEDVLYNNSTQNLLDDIYSAHSNHASVKEIYEIVSSKAQLLGEAIRKATQSLKKPEQQNQRIFAVPPQAIRYGKELISYIQFKADILNEFKQTYGVDAKSLFTGIVTDINDKIKKEMIVLGVDNLVDFVTVKLEKMLGDNYVVTPTYKVEDLKTRRKYDGINAYDDFLQLENSLDYLDTPDFNYKHFDMIQQSISRLGEWGKSDAVIKFEQELRPIYYAKGKYDIIAVVDYLKVNKDRLIELLQPIYERTEEAREIARSERKHLETPIVTDFEIIEKKLAEDLLLPELSNISNLSFVDMFEKSPVKDVYKSRELKEFLKLGNGKYSIKRFIKMDS